MYSTGFRIFNFYLLALTTKVALPDAGPETFQRSVATLPDDTTG